MHIASCDAAADLPQCHISTPPAFHAALSLSLPSPPCRPTYPHPHPSLPLHRRRFPQGLQRGARDVVRLHPCQERNRGCKGLLAVPVRPQQEQAILRRLARQSQALRAARASWAPCARGTALARAMDGWVVGACRAGGLSPHAQLLLGGSRLEGRRRRRLGPAGREGDQADTRAGAAWGRLQWCL